MRGSMVIRLRSCTNRGHTTTVMHKPRSYDYGHAQTEYTPRPSPSPLLPPPPTLSPLLSPSLFPSLFPPPPPLFSLPPSLPPPLPSSLPPSNPSFPSTLRPFSPFPSPPHLRPHTTQRCYLRGTRDDVLRLFQFAQSERPRPVPGRPPAAPAVGNPLSVDRNGVLLPGRRVSCVFFEGGLFNVVAECGVSFVASGERHHASS